MTRRITPFRTLTADRAADQVVVVEDSLARMELGESGSRMLASVHQALEARKLDDVVPDPNSKVEVEGLVMAAMGDNDHMAEVRLALCHYVVGLVQTTPDKIEEIRQAYGNGALRIKIGEQ